MSSVDVRAGGVVPGAASGLDAGRIFSVGQMMRLRKGLMAGALGRFLAARNSHRVILEVCLREKTVTVDLPVDDVEKME